MEKSFQREAVTIPKKTSINLIIHYPKTEAGKSELARRLSEVHAATVTQRIQSLNCPTSQKLALLDAIIETVKTESRERI